MPADKRTNEWSILRTVYDVDEFSAVVESERPDFLLWRFAEDPWRRSLRSRTPCAYAGVGARPALRPRRSSPTRIRSAFGVEVTEVFATEADARAVNHPEYLAELFDGGRYKHRADKKLLPVVRVRVTNRDGAVTHEDLPAIFTPFPSEVEHHERIAEVIRRKSERGYLVDGNRINLVIRDRFRLSGEVLDEEYSVTDLLSGGVRTALLDSPFREVYLVSVGRTGEQVVRPLQQLMLAEQFFTFAKSAEAALGRPDLDEQWKYVQSFADFSERRGLSVTLHDNRGHPVAAYRSAAVGLDEGWSLQLLDLADHVDSGLPEWNRRVVDEFSAPFELVIGDGCEAVGAAAGYQGVAIRRAELTVSLRRDRGYGQRPEVAEFRAFWGSRTRLLDVSSVKPESSRTRFGDELAPST